MLKKKLSKTWSVQVKLFDTNAMQRSRSCDDPRPGLVVEPETKKARLDRDETARDLVAKIFVADGLLRVNT